MLQLLKSSATFIAVIFLLGSLAEAQINMGPRGLKTSLLANSGISLIADSSAGVLNPASLVGLKENRLSASSSVAQLTRVSLVTDSQIIDRSQEGQFGLSSGYISSFMSNKDWNYGFYAVEEVNVEFLKYLEYAYLANGAAMGSSQVQMKMKMDRIGFIFGQGTGNLKWALSPMIYLLNRSSSSMGKVQSGADTQVSFRDLKLQSYAFSLRGGLTYQTDLVNYGVYFEPQGLLIQNKQTLYAAEISTSGSVFDSSNSNESTETTPPQLGLGVTFKDVLYGQLHFDMIGWASIDYMDKSELNVDEQNRKTQNVQRYGVGYVQNIKDDVAYGGGLQYSDLRDARQNGQNFEILYVSVGRQQKINFLNTYFNLFHSYYKTKGSSTSTITTFGLSLGTEYSY